MNENGALHTETEQLQARADHLQTRVHELEHYIALQTNTIAAFKQRTITLEMEIVELMSQLPHVYMAAPAEMDGANDPG